MTGRTATSRWPPWPVARRASRSTGSCSALGLRLELLWWWAALAVLHCVEPVSARAAKKLPDIYWNSSNPMFRIDNTDHIIDVNKGNLPFEFDQFQVDLICPLYKANTPASLMETYMIYMVSRHEYETCSLLHSSTLRPIARCDGNAGRELKYTITFRSFTPQPGGHEFRPGNNYYIVSTSTGRPGGLEQEHGGACQQYNMRLTFKVCCKPGEYPDDYNVTAGGDQRTDALPTTPLAPNKRPQQTDRRGAPPGGDAAFGDRSTYQSDWVRRWGSAGEPSAYDSESAVGSTHLRLPDGISGIAAGAGGRSKAAAGSSATSSAAERYDRRTPPASGASSPGTRSRCAFCKSGSGWWLWLLVIAACVTVSLTAVFVVR